MTRCGTCGENASGRFCGACGAPLPGQPRELSPHPPPYPPALADDVTVPRYAAPLRPGPVVVAAGSPGPAQAFGGGISPGAPAPRARAPWVVPILVTVLVLTLGIGGYVVFGRVTAGAAASGGSAGSAAHAEPPATAAGAPRQPVPSAAPSASPSGTASPTAPSMPPSTPPPDPRRAASDRLEELARQDATRNVVRGQWVAQLASKYEGIVDPLVRPEPFTLPEILAEHEALRSNPVFGASVRLLHQGDWGRAAAHDPPMFVTVADINAGSADAVRAWCQAHFAQRGRALENVCYVRQLTLRGS